MDWIVIALLIVVVLAIMVVKFSQKHRGSASEYPYIKEVKRMLNSFIQ
ncbi:MAG: hypothetical protein JRE64_08920 [Deltaproteobacteria bacterium]|nr:hypothetical protein [Deltaproteobacteria bacterium]